MMSVCHQSNWKLHDALNYLLEKQIVFDKTCYFLWNTDKLYNLLSIALENMGRNNIGLQFPISSTFSTVNLSQLLAALEKCLHEMNFEKP